MGVGNLLGQPFLKYVNKQVEIRQEVYGSGFSGKNTTSNRRLAAYQQYLNSRTPWIKLASGIIVEDKREEQITEEVGDTTTQETRTYEGGLRFLEKLSLPDSYKGVNLAREAVLFSGLQGTGDIIPVQDQTITRNGEEITVQNANAFTGDTIFNPRFGLSKSTNVWNLEAAYGLGGLDFGQQPMPGITDASIKSLNRGSIKRAEVTIKANNRYQFDLIEILYLRLGYTMLLEWGNSHYLPNEGGETVSDPTTGVKTTVPIIDTIKNTYIEDKWFQQNGQSTYNVLQDLENLRVKYSGNYDAFYGKVVNFNWSFNPDGTYDINLSLISMGDIVESLKFNSLYHPSDGVPVNEGDNVNDPVNHINAIKLNPQLFNAALNGSPYLSLVEYSDIPSQLPEKKEGEEEDDALKFQRKVSGLQNKYGYYWRFGDFIGWIQKHIIPTYTSGNEEFKQIRIDADELTNVMSAYPNQFSVDPRVCIVRTNYGSKLQFNEDPPFYKHMAKWVSIETPIGEVPEAPHGKIMNIYINFNQISSIINANKNKNGDVDFYTFFEKLLDNINKALGGINNLELVVEEDSNTIKIIDQNIIAGSAVDKQSGVNFYNKFIKDLRVADKSTKLEVFGYNQRSGSFTSNFVKDFKFESKIDKNLANTLSISAAAGGGFVGEDTTAFSSWSRGLVDKYKEFVNPPEQDNIPPNISNENPYYKVNTYRKRAKNAMGTLVKDFYFDEQGNIVDNTEAFNRTVGSGDSSFTTPEANYEKIQRNEMIGSQERLMYTYTGTEYFITQAGHDKLKQLSNNIFNLDIGYFITECFGTNITGRLVPQIVQNNSSDKAEVLAQISQGNQPNRTEVVTKDGGRYDEFNSALIARGESAMKNYFLQMGEAHFKETGKPTGRDGFIPLDLGLTVDGISGIKIYNSINVDTSFLPSTYGDDLDFIVRGVNHKLGSGEWSTEIESLSIPRPTVKIFEKEDVNLYDDINLSGSIVTSSIELPEPIYTPIFGESTSANVYLIRMDEDGKGLFGAPRTTSKSGHKGLDFLVRNNIGTNRGPTNVTVRAPFSGNVRQANPSMNTPNLTGVEITGTGKYEGYVCKMFYVSPELEKDNRSQGTFPNTIGTGDLIGYAQDMLGEGKYNPPKNKFMQNHIHFEMTYNGEQVPLQSSVNDPGKVDWIHSNIDSANPIKANFEIQGVVDSEGIDGINELKVKEKITSEWKRISTGLNNAVTGGANTDKFKAVLNTIDQIITDSFGGEPTQTLQQIDEKLPLNQQNKTDRGVRIKSTTSIQEFKNTFIDLYIFAEKVPADNAKYNSGGKSSLKLMWTDENSSIFQNIGAIAGFGQNPNRTSFDFIKEYNTGPANKRSARARRDAIDNVPYDVFFMLLVIDLYDDARFDDDTDDALEEYYGKDNNNIAKYMKDFDL